MPREQLVERSYEEPLNAEAEACGSPCFKIQGAGLRVRGLGFQDYGLRFGVAGSGFRLSNLAGTCPPLSK